MDIYEYLKENIGESRYQHSLRVASEARKLARLYSVDEEAAYIGGLFHDIAKLEDMSKLLKIGEAFGIINPERKEENLEIIHGPIGARIARDKFQIYNKDILNAISYHTTGRENMSDLEKVVFIADYIEPGRSFEGLEDVRNLAYKNLDESVILAINQTIKFLLDKGKIISIKTIEARNSLIVNRRG